MAPSGPAAIPAETAPGVHGNVQKRPTVGGNVMGVDAAEGRLSPTALVATTVKVGVVVTSRPLTTQVVLGAGAVQVAPPGDAVTV